MTTEESNFRASCEYEQHILIFQLLMSIETRLRAIERALSPTVPAPLPHDDFHPWQSPGTVATGPHDDTAIRVTCGGSGAVPLAEHFQGAQHETYHSMPFKSPCWPDASKYYSP